MSNCKICGRITSKIKCSKNNVSYNRCFWCEFISKDDEFIVSEKEELKTYNNHNNSIDDFKYVKYFKEFIDATIMPYIKFGSVLDFGNGPSPVLRQILERDYDFKVDIYDHYYQPQKIYKTKKYDLIVCTEVVEHLKDPLYYFKIFQNHLKKDGYLAITTLFHHNYSDFLLWHYIRDMTHISFYTPKTMNFIGNQIGFNMIYHNDCRYVAFKKISEEVNRE